MYEIERLELAEKLTKKGISDEKVLKAIREVERHLFVPEIMVPHAYEDSALPIGFSQTISQPFTVAYMTEALKAAPGDRILEIGTGSGYQAAILNHMGMKVFTIERQDEIFLRTQKLFDKLGLRIVCRLGDGTIGWAEFSPYDGIIVTAGGPTVPENLKKQLAIGGRLVIPVGDKESQTLKIITKVAEDDFDVKDVPKFKFVPLIGREGWKEK
ncbi:MAG TPA: protein-L-isoaspartate(D-aspartate) O-methyltransferase [Ignavibacteriales bacterium]|nr:protein-L-isoaspartate(D-aspartate) O-methyltransferase [Ignavibacteriales bacterium]HEX3071994.1 protein-L-isoaspartate(D-aspartate) O-methyltransferase [Ignavibacteriales bacterium]